MGIREKDTGVTPGEITWTTAHGDRRWANLTGPALALLDWEGWGTAPLGYDAASLYLHSLPVPDVAERIRKEFAQVLDTPAGRVGELTACTEILQAAPECRSTPIWPMAYGSTFVG